MSIFTLAFVIDAAERAIKTGAQTAAALLTGDGFGLLTVDWSTIGSVAGLAVVASLLTSVASSGVGDHGAAAALPGGGDHRAGKPIED